MNFIEIYYLSARAGFVSDPVASLLPVDQLDVHVHEWGPGPPGRPVPGRRGRGARSCLSQPVPLAVIVLFTLQAPQQITYTVRAPI